MQLQEKTSFMSFRANFLKTNVYYYYSDSSINISINSCNYHKRTSGSCMYLLYIFDRWVSLVVINIGFQENRMKRLETSSFVIVAWIYWYIDRWVTIVEINIGFQEISMKWYETSFFLVVAWIYCIYLIDECQKVVIDIGFQEIILKRLETTFFVVVACIVYIW